MSSTLLKPDAKDTWRIFVGENRRMHHTRRRAVRHVAGREERNALWIKCVTRVIFWLVVWIFIIL